MEIIKKAVEINKKALEIIKTNNNGNQYKKSVEISDTIGGAISISVTHPKPKKLPNMLTY